MTAHFTITEASEDQLRSAEAELVARKRVGRDYKERWNLAQRINAIRAELRRRRAA